VHTLGIDLGGTYARAGVVDAEGRIVAAAKTALTSRTPEAVVAAIQGAASDALELAKETASEVASCGIGVAGQLRPGGFVSVAPNLGWRDVPFGQLLAAALGRNVRVVNDLAAAAWGEFSSGAGRGVNDIFVVFVGSGVGSSMISGGRQLVGATGVAGEFGHTKVVPGPNGRQCGCGERGCLEAYVGGHNLNRQMREAVERVGAGTRLFQMAAGDLGKLTYASLEEAALGGDAAAKEIYDTAAFYLGVAVANMVTVLNPARLILGGGVLNHCPGLRQRVEEHVMAFANANARAAVQVKTAALGDDSGLIGAALLARSAAG
jgi:glucokinase